MTRGSVEKRLKIKSIYPDGLLGNNSILESGDLVETINGTPCEYLSDAREAAKLIVDSEQAVTVVVERKSDNAAVMATAA